MKIFSKIFPHSFFLILGMLLFHSGLQAQSQAKTFSAGLHLGNFPEGGGGWIQTTAGYQLNGFLYAQAGFGIKPVSPLLGNRCFRLGIMGEIFEVKRFSFHLGTHYFYNRLDVSELSGRKNIREGHMLELSGNVFYRINPNYTIQLAVHSFLLSNRSDDRPGRDRQPYEYWGLNLGCNYHF